MIKYADILDEHNLKTSHQRTKILEYLSNNPCHPTADKVLLEMKKELPTLSKSTVYKTLNAFVDAGLLREITIENNEIRYEYNLHDHGHFKCNDCGEVYDFSFDYNGLKSDDLEGFEIYEKDLFLKGVCKSCLMHKA